MKREINISIEIVTNLDTIYDKMVDLYGRQKAIEYFVKRCKKINRYIKEIENIKEKSNY